MKFRTLGAHTDWYCDGRHNTQGANDAVRLLPSRVAIARLGPTRQREEPIKHAENAGKFD